jgi:hypothetical protein
LPCSVFNCAPTDPPGDGTEYMDGNLSIVCGQAGSLQARTSHVLCNFPSSFFFIVIIFFYCQVKLIAPAVICLLVYVIGIPVAAASFLYAKRDAITYDQIL